jgi:CRP/FNR family transcriptional regulator, cyclic AMP receptor protein
MEPADHLRSVPIFEGLTDSEINEIALAAQEREFEEGAFIVTQGSAGLGFYLLIEGKVRVVRNQKTMAEFGPTGFFGEMSLLESVPRSASVVAIKPTKCLVIGSWDFRTLLMKEPSIAIKMLEVMSRRLRESQEHVGPD